MKVIEEIIDYLERRGLLGEAEIEALERAGYAPSRERYEDRYDQWYEAYDDPGPGPEEAAAERPLLRAPRGGGPRRGPAVRASDIAARARAFFAEQGDALGALGRATEGPASATRWQRIALVGRGEAAPLAEAVGEAIERRGVSFRTLWEALSLDQYLYFVTAAEHGPAASAYRALLKVREVGETGRHGWLFRKRSIARVFDLVLAQRRLAEAFLHVYRDRPALFGKWLARDGHPVAYWSFVLLYNAERSLGGVPLRPLAGECPARRAMPDARGLARAWSTALSLGGERVRPFLADLWDADLEAHRVPLFCPTGWDRSVRPLMRVR
ncbi:MAG TPA: hypothetical protein VFS00_16610 [Polyangiaceae bacterium]|nr:hypothetical protein [Polyangiaceae bacterium]